MHFLFLLIPSVASCSKDAYLLIDLYNFALWQLMKVFSNKLQEEQVNGELECLVLASDGLWDVVENEVRTLLPSSAVQ
jgi:serine/threonine protein phosphatase PrpC